MSFVSLGSPAQFCMEFRSKQFHKITILNALRSLCSRCAHQAWEHFSVEWKPLPMSDFTVFTVERTCATFHVNAESGPFYRASNVNLVSSEFNTKLFFLQIFKSSTPAMMAACCTLDVHSPTSHSLKVPTVRAAPRAIPHVLTDFRALVTFSERSGRKIPEGS